MENEQLTLMKKVGATMIVDSIIPLCEIFKIGKTGQPIDDRFDNSDYPKHFDRITEVFRGDKKEVDDMESYLIDYYKNNPKCVNGKDGGASNNDPMKPNAKIYYVYVVWKAIK